MDLTNIIPEFSPLHTDWTGLIEKSLWVFLVCTCIFILIKFNQNRRLIEIYEKVEGGYVTSKRRYGTKFDKDNLLAYLKPMFGKDKLPDFSYGCWQKTKGIPFIGIRRVLYLLKLNKHSYQVLIPPKYKSEPLTKYENTLSWVFIEQKREFLKKYNKEKFLEFLVIAAPCFIIVGCIIFWSVAMFTQAQIYDHAADKIDTTTRIIVELVK